MMNLLAVVNLDLNRTTLLYILRIFEREQNGTSRIKISKISLEPGSFVDELKGPFGKTDVSDTETAHARAKTRKFEPRWLPATDPEIRQHLMSCSLGLKL